MAFDLNPLALANAPILRIIARATDHEIASIKGLAQAVGRDDSNVGKSLKALEAAGIINPDPLMNGLTPDGEAQLAALERAANPEAVGALTALLSDLDPHPLNPRKDFESDEAEDGLNELRESILLRGLMQPIVVRPRPEVGKWWIVDGERRFRAIKQANWDGDWDDDKPVPIVVRDVDDREHLLLSLTANLQRADMSAIEEGHAFHAAVHDFGLGTEDLANELGKSQRYVQQRIALLKLSPEDQNRMRLPRDHPHRLTFKQARTLTQTARPVDPAARLPLPPSEEFSRMVADQPHLTMPGGEPGSSATAAPVADSPDFDSTLSHKEALLLVEIADKSDRDPAPEFAPEPYARIQAVPVKGEAQSLVEKNVLGFRHRGMHVFVRARVHTSGAHDWLAALGFYGEHRADVLFEMRARVLGHDRARELAESGEYATAWLNPTGDPMRDGGEGRVAGPMDAMADYAAERRQAEPEAEPEAEPRQPALIEETDEERRARQSAEQERAAGAKDREVAQRLADEVTRALADARRGHKPFGEALAGNGSNEGLAALVAAAFGALAAAEPELAAAAIAQLLAKGGSMGARYALQHRTLPEIERMMVEARVAKRDPNRASAADAQEPDPVEDFVQAELEEEEADAGGVMENAPHYKPGPADPAVPIRKSITPDFIVCLEDGRKLKSLKRHLRTRYNLSPEEYRAKWGLAADYPMVAPNYAKARADLARQMGLEPQA